MPWEADVRGTHSTMTNGGVSSISRVMPRCESARSDHVSPRTAAPLPSLPPHPSTVFLAGVFAGVLAGVLAGVDVSFFAGVFFTVLRGEARGDAGVLSGVLPGMVDPRRVVTGMAGSQRLSIDRQRFVSSARAGEQRPDGIVHPADTSRSNLAAALALVRGVWGWCVPNPNLDPYPGACWCCPPSTTFLGATYCLCRRSNTCCDGGSVARTRYSLALTRGQAGVPNSLRCGKVICRYLYHYKTLLRHMKLPAGGRRQCGASSGVRPGGERVKERAHSGPEPRAL
jgi:hypothetical protein